MDCWEFILDPASSLVIHYSDSLLVADGGNMGKLRDWNVAGQRLSLVGRAMVFLLQGWRGPVWALRVRWWHTAHHRLPYI